MFYLPDDHLTKGPNDVQSVRHQPLDDFGLLVQETSGKETEV